MDAVREKVRPGLSGIVELLYLKIALPDNIIVRAHDSSNRGQKHGVCRQICRKLVTVREKRVWTHRKTDGGANVTTSADVQESREQSRQVGSRADRVCCNVGAQLSQRERRRNDEDAEALPGAAVVDEMLQKVQGVPDRIAVVDDGRARRDEDADEARHGESQRDGDQLRQQRVLGLSREPREIRVVYDQRREVGDGAHYARDELPCQLRP